MTDPLRSVFAFVPLQQRRSLYGGGAKAVASVYGPRPQRPLADVAADQLVATAVSRHGPGALDALAAAIERNRVQQRAVAGEGQSHVEGTREPAEQDRRLPREARRGDR